MRLRNERAGQREFLLHPAAKLPGQPVRERRHPEEVEIVQPAGANGLRRGEPQIADVADVLHHGEVGIERETLRQIAGLQTGVARGLSKDLDRARGGIHHAGQDFERRRLPRSVRTDEPEDLALVHVERNAANGFDVSVTFVQVAQRDGYFGHVPPARI